MSAPLPSNFPFATVVVTGGSSGIGKSFITHIGKLNPQARICNLSRRQPDGIEANLNLRHIETDLGDNRSRRAGLEQLLGELRGPGPNGPILLLNNAGLGHYGAFADTAIDRHLNLLEVNVAAVLEVTAALLPLLRERGGTILNVASVVSFQPTPMMSTYGASKAFLLHWSYALRSELKGSGVEVLAVCPGSTQSAFHDRAGMSRGGMAARVMQSADAVVEESLAALRSPRGHVVTGWLNKVQCFFAARLPLRWSTALAARVLAAYAKPPGSHS